MASISGSVYLKKAIKSESSRSSFWGGQSDQAHDIIPGCRSEDFFLTSLHSIPLSVNNQITFSGRTGRGLSLGAGLGSAEGT